MRVQMICFLGRISLLVCLFLTGCASNESEPGVVARVNGEPIYLSQLESEYDLVSVDWSSENEFDVTSLRTEYGDVLARLILQVLIRQTLVREGLAVTDEEVARAESVIRSDYPDAEGFEQTLVDEYVDIEHWRKGLRARLSAEKFLQSYLRPTVTVTYEAARAYYREHIADFLVPERFVFAVIDGNDRETLAAAVAAYRKQGVAGSDIQKSGVAIHEMNVSLPALSPAWRDLLSSLEPGQATAVQTDRKTLTVLYLEKRIPETVLSPSKAYPLVENLVLEEKLKAAFAAWLHEVSTAAGIETTPLLKLGGKEDAASPAGDTNAT